VVVISRQYGWVATGRTPKLWLFVVSWEESLRFSHLSIVANTALPLTLAAISISPVGISVSECVGFEGYYKILQPDFGCRTRVQRRQHAPPHHARQHTGGGGAFPL